MADGASDPCSLSVTSVSPSEPLRPLRLSLSLFPSPCLSSIQPDAAGHSGRRGQKGKFLPVNVFSLVTLDSLLHVLLAYFLPLFPPDVND